MRHLAFSHSFEVIICLDGDLPGPEFFAENFPGTRLVAADGAALKLRRMNLSPAVIIGDLDTFAKHCTRDDFPDSEIVYLPDQESNDFEKALVWCREQNLSPVLVCGFHGGELEHTLNNWSVLKKFTGTGVCIYDAQRYGLPLNESVLLRSYPGETISIIPQPRARLTTRNLRWPLQSEVLELGRREGARNESTAEEFALEILEGEILLFIEARLPFAASASGEEGQDL